MCIQPHRWDLTHNDYGSQTAILPWECSSAMPEKTELNLSLVEVILLLVSRCQHCKVSASQSYKSSQSLWWKKEQMDGKEILPSCLPCFPWSVPSFPPARQCFLSLYSRVCISHGLFSLTLVFSSHVFHQYLCNPWELEYTNPELKGVHNILTVHSFCQNPKLGGAVPDSRDTQTCRFYSNDFT